jgi:hypothetical protein
LPCNWARQFAFSGAQANFYSNAPPIMVRIVAPVLGCRNDPERIPFNHFAITFALVADKENPPGGAEYKARPKDTRDAAKATPRLSRNWPLPLR